MKKNKDFDCVEMKRSGAKKIYERTQNMTLLEELSYWQQQTEKLQQRQVDQLGSTSKTPPKQCKRFVHKMAKTDADIDEVREDDCFTVPEGESISSIVERLGNL